MSSNLINYNTGRAVISKAAEKEYEVYYQERRKRAQQRKARQIAKRRMVALLASILLIVVGCVIFGSIFSSAYVNEADREERYYKSIEIQKGDTLWNIAQEYATDMYYESTQAYVDEIKQVNGLKSNTIHEGQHLIVVYNDVKAK